MEQDRNQTPRANRIHIGFFGRRNAGKSSLINAVTGQQVSVVSDILGTTTDTVEKAMELLPIGPVVLIDTPGLDDSGALGELRVQRAKQTFSHTDIAVLVVDASVGMTQDDRRILQALTEKHIPALSVWNKWDLAENTVLPEGAIAVSAATGDGIEALKERLGAFYRERTATQKPRHLFGNLLAPEDVVVLVTPIDESAPKGRMILPQVQAIREILDGHAICLAAQPQQLPAVLRLLNRPPRLVVTDSQAFGQIKEIVPAEIPLTSFSILFAQLKGVLEPARKAAQTLEQLSDGSRILISEGCTHHPAVQRYWHRQAAPLDSSAHRKDVSVCIYLWEQLSGGSHTIPPCGALRRMHAEPAGDGEPCSTGCKTRCPLHQLWCADRLPQRDSGTKSFYSGKNPAEIITKPTLRFIERGLFWVVMVWLCYFVFFTAATIALTIWISIIEPKLKP